MSEQAELTRAATRDKIQTVNPATGKPGRAYDPHTIDDAHQAAAAAHEAFLAWRRTSFADRSAIVRRDFITGFTRNPSGRWIALLGDATEQPVGRLYSDRVRAIAGR